MNKNKISLIIFALLPVCLWGMRGCGKKKPIQLTPEAPMSVSNPPALSKPEASVSGRTASSTESLDEENLNAGSNEAYYKDAVEAVKVVFSKLWVGIPIGKGENQRLTYVTALKSGGGKPASPAASSSSQVFNISLTDNELRLIGMGQSSDGAEGEHDAISDTHEPLRLIQIVKPKDFFLFIDEQYVSEADQLNGISFRGDFLFYFSAYREYKEPEGWTLFKEVERPGSATASVLQGWKGIAYKKLGMLPGKGREQAPGLLFHVQKRGDAWSITTSQGAAFINGKLVESTATLQKDSEGTIAKGIAYSLPRQVIEEVIKNADGEAKNYSRLIKDSKLATPEQLKLQESDTLKMLNQ